MKRFCRICMNQSQGLNQWQGPFTLQGGKWPKAMRVKERMLGAIVGVAAPSPRGWDGTLKPVSQWNRRATKVVVDQRGRYLYLTFRPPTGLGAVRDNEIVRNVRGLPCPRSLSLCRLASAPLCARSTLYWILPLWRVSAWTLCDTSPQVELALELLLGQHT